MTQSTIPQAAGEREIIIPRREIECHIERATERGERLFGAVENFSHARPRHPAMVGGRAIAVILAPHVVSICSAKVPSPPAASCTSTLLPAAFSRVSPAPRTRQPHRDEAVGKRCQHRKIPAGRGPQHVSHIYQNVTGVGAVRRRGLQSIDPITGLERRRPRSDARCRAGKIVAEYHWKLACAE